MHGEPVLGLGLNKPELENFIVQQVKEGHFPSPDAAIEAAVEQMMYERNALDIDDETAEAIKRAEEQLDRGEGIDFKQFAADMRNKFSTP